MTEPSLTPGSRFYKSDFHNHTPASKDFPDRSVSPEQIIQSAAITGIEILAITDHNTAEWVDRVAAAGKGSGVTVVPGVEITTPEGHILALFDVGYGGSKITDLLIEIGIGREMQGREEAISKNHAEEVIKEIHAARGLAIAAHANENNGLLKVKGQYKFSVFKMPELASIELTKQDEIERFSEGKVVPDFPAKACTQSSDSHALSEIGRRVTYLKMHEVSLQGIRQALLDYRVRVRFPWNYQIATHPRIIELQVNQGFFGDQAFLFHENLNCLVGGKGTGKSTVIELLRYCLDDVSPFDIIKEDHQGKILSLVGHGGTITVRYIDSDGEIKTIRRTVQPWEEEREIRDNSGDFCAIETPPAFFSQGELVQIASSPIALLDLLDRRLDLSTEDEEERTVTQRLRENAVELIGAIDRIRMLETEINDPEKGKSATDTQYKKLERQLKDPILKDFPSWETEQAYIDQLGEALDALPERLGEVISEIDLEQVHTTLPPDSPNSTLLKELESIGSSVERGLEKLQTDFVKVVAEQKAKIQRAFATWKPLFDAKKQQYDALLAKLGQADVWKATAQFRSLGKRLESLRAYETELKRRAQQKKELEDERKELRKRLKRARNDRWKKRDDKAKVYQKALDDLIEIKVALGGDRSEYAEKIRGLSKTGYVQDPNIKQLAAKLEPDILLQHVLNRDADAIARDAGVTPEVARRVVESFSGKPLQDLYELEEVALPDYPEIFYFVDPERKKPLRELSTGQKGTVIIALAMIEGNGPLVIDQPEEPLDTQSIYNQVVRTLRKSKDARQFIFTTHNPNIAVGADAELSHVLTATADKGTIQSSGAVDHPETNKLLLLHLEGGKEALELRVKKYV